MRKLQRPQKKTLDTFSIDELAVTLDETSSAAGAGDEKYNARISLDSIHKLSNPRETFANLDDIRSTDWPSLDIPLEDLVGSIDAAVRNSQWSKSFSLDEMGDAIDFFCEIHELAKSLMLNRQLQPIIIERTNKDTNTGTLVAGERRTIAAIYTKGLIKELNAEIWNIALTPLQRARIKDAENNDRKALNSYELVCSKMGVYDALPGAESLEIKDLAVELGYSTLSTPSILARVFRSANREDVLERIRREKVPLRSIPKLLDGATPRAGKEDNEPMAKIAKRYGLSVGKGTDTQLLTMLIEAALRSDSLSLSLRNAFAEHDISSPKGLTQAWGTAANALVESKIGSN